MGDELFPTLRWLLTQAAGTIADAAHRLENDADGIDDHARAQLADDVLTLEEELAVLKGLMGGPVDWDADFERLLDGEIAPFDDDADEDDD